MKNKESIFLIFVGIGVFFVSLTYGVVPNTTLSFLYDIEVNSINLSNIFRAIMGLYKQGSLVELTSSSLNKPTTAARISRSVKFVPNSIKKQLIETDKFLTTEIYNFENFGLIKINTQTQEIEISLNDVDGNELFSDKI